MEAEGAARGGPAGAVPADEKPVADVDLHAAGGADDAERKRLARARSASPGVGSTFGRCGSGGRAPVDATAFRECHRRVDADALSLPPPDSCVLNCSLGYETVDPERARRERGR